MFHILFILQNPEQHISVAVHQSEDELRETEAVDISQTKPPLGT